MIFDTIEVDPCHLILLPRLLAAKWEENIQNSLPAFDYLATDARYWRDVNHALAQPVHVFLVFKVNVDASWAYVCSGVNSVLGILTESFETLSSMTAGVNLGYNVAAGWHIFDCLFDGVNSDFNVDGVNLGTGNVGANALNYISLGCGSSDGYAYQDYIALWAYYHGELSGDARTDYLAHLSTRYDIAVT